MGAETRKINRSLMIGWTIIALVLFVSYIGEYLKGVRTGTYVVVFLICTIIPCLYCIYRYRRWPDSDKLKIYIVAGYFIMYLFSMITGSTNMVFSYILPMLSLLVLYHQPKLIMWTGIASVIVNLYFIASRFLSGELGIVNSKDAEIQIALILLCFGGSYAATLIYDEITKQNINFMVELEEKNRQNQQMTFQTIMTIVNTIDAKDQYTKGHSQRVSEYSVAIAKELGMAEEELEKIRYIALLHDIGKIGVPDNILNKQGKLTNEEFALMKMHTVVGGEILKDIKTVEGLDVGAKYHHERYDGRGYPDGLKGEDIPYIARIICVADAYDAMTSNRVYRKRLSTEDVEKEIERCIGSQFDPDIGAVFLKLLREKRIDDISPDHYVETKGTNPNMANQLLQKVLESTGGFVDASNELDLLTSIYNKKRGEELLDVYLSNSDGCLIVIDVNTLHNINEQYGVVRGDLYLKTTVHLLNTVFDDKILYRNDGDEFICFLCGVMDLTKLEKMVSEFFQKLEKAKAEDKVLDELTFSVGAAFSGISRHDREELYSCAIRALAAAKKKGGNSFCEFQSLYVDKTQNLSKIDLENLIMGIRGQNEYSNTFREIYPEFVRTIGYIKKVSERNEHKMHLVLFTVLAADEGNASLTQKAEVMGIMHRAVALSLRSNDVTTQFSSSQWIVIFMDLDQEETETLINNIVSSFYKMNTCKSYSVSYDIAEL